MKGCELLSLKLLNSRLILSSLTFGVVDSALHWMTSYLTGRTQYVRYRAEVSTTRHVYCGVPRCSVLGPVLFLLYVADVIELVKECGLIPHAFADDLQITVIVSRQTLRNWSPV